MPPMAAARILPTPWPKDSRVLSEWVSVMSSTSLAVSSDSIRPTKAMPMAYGAISCRVSRFHGISGTKSPGSEVGSSPWSATSGTFHPAATAMMLTTRMVISGAGITVVNRGSPSMIARPMATSRYTIHGTSIRCGSCVVNIMMPSAFTNPVITERGIKRMSLATPTAANTTCMIPAKSTAATT